MVIIIASAAGLTLLQLVVWNGEPGNLGPSPGLAGANRLNLYLAIVAQKGPVCCRSDWRATPEVECQYADYVWEDSPCQGPGTACD
jgi:hypothetical protein